MPGEVNDRVSGPHELHRSRLTDGVCGPRDKDARTEHDHNQHYPDAERGRWFTESRG